MHGVLCSCYGTNQAQQPTRQQPSHVHRPVLDTIRSCGRSCCANVSGLVIDLQPTSLASRSRLRLPWVRLLVTSRMPIAGLRPRRPLLAPLERLAEGWACRAG